MNLEGIEQDFRNKVCEKLKISTEGVDRFRVFTPFMFEDGDHLAIVLKRENGGWILSDEGHTYMHLTYDLDEKDLQRVTQVVTEVVEQHITQAPTGDDTDGEVKNEIEHLVAAPPRIRFHRAVAAQPPSAEKAGDVHEPIPVDLNRTKTDGDGINIRGDQHTGDYEVASGARPASHACPHHADQPLTNHAFHTMTLLPR